MKYFYYGFYFFTPGGHPVSSVDSVETIVAESDSTIVARRIGGCANY